VKRRRGGSGRGRFAKLEAGGRRTRSPPDAWVQDLPVSVKAREWRGRPWGFALRCVNTRRALMLVELVVGLMLDSEEKPRKGPLRFCALLFETHALCFSILANDGAREAISH
jgi:hypothetical protein